MALFAPGLLLFCIQRTERGYLYYFADAATLKSGLPELVRFGGGASLARELTLGGVYDVEYSGLRIKRFELDEKYNISGRYYAMLSELRALKYDKSHDWNEQDYYSFTELKELLAYKRSVLRAVGEYILRLIVTAPALLLPAALYVGYVYLMLKLSPENPFAVPVISVAALPLAVLLVGGMYFLARRLLSSLEFTRTWLLRAFALRTCGARHAAGFGGVSLKARRRLLIYALSSGALPLLSLLTLLG